MPEPTEHAPIEHRLAAVFLTARPEDSAGLAEGLQSLFGATSLSAWSFGHDASGLDDGILELQAGPEGPPAVDPSTLRAGAWCRDDGLGSTFEVVIPGYPNERRLLYLRAAAIAIGFDRETCRRLGQILHDGFANLARQQGFATGGRQIEPDLGLFGLEHATEGVLVLDRDGEIVFANDSIARLLDRRREEVVGMKLQALDPALDTETLGERWKSLRQDHRRESEHTLLRLDGTPIRVRSDLVFGQVEHRELVFLFVHDEREALSQEARLRETESLKGAILDTALDCVITVDADGRIVEWNPAAVQTFGWSLDEIRGQKLSETIVPEELRAAHELGMARYLATGEHKVLGKRIEIDAIHQDGTRFPVELAIHPLVIDGRHLFTATVRDITERKMTEDALLEARDAAERASRAKSIFLANMSHEIRTPMTAIVGYSRLLCGDDQNERRGDWSRLIRQNADHLLSLIDDVLDLSRIEAGKLPLHELPTDLHALARDTVDWFRPDANEKLLELRCRIDDDVPVGVSTDATRVRQVLSNLIGNSIKHTERGLVELHLKASEPSDGRCGITFSIADTGAGIPPERLERLFEPFIQASARKGTGLGLAIVKTLTERLGGKVSAQSVAGLGSRFDVTLPLELCEPPEGQPVEDGAVASAGTAEALQDARVLIVDDSSDNRAILNILLSRAGLDCEEAVDGRAAVERFEAPDHAFDLVLMDLQMPRLDGYSALRELRQKGVRVPIVAVTAFALDDDQKRCLEAGFDAYLSKPIDESELFSLLRREIRREVAPHQIDKRQDPAFAALIARYREGLPGMIEDLDRITGDREALSTFAHRIRGSAATYGFASLGERAGQLEDRLRAETPLEQLGIEITGLRTALQRAMDAD